MMSMQMIAEPSVEPVTLDEAKLFMRLDTADDDALVSGLVTASRRLVEQMTRKCLLQQTWQFGFDQWPCNGFVRLPLSPLVMLSSVTVMDATGNRIAQTLANFQINGLITSPTIQARTALPVPAIRECGIQTDCVMGYGNLASQVPQPLKLAVLMMVSRLYETRGLGDSSVPESVLTLLAPFTRRAI